MIEDIADKMYEFITSKGAECIQNLKEQYNNQIILYGIIKRFGEGDYFNQEYRSMLYVDHKDIILQIPEDKLLPTLTSKEICENIHEVIGLSFIGDNNLIDNITEIITAEYLSKRGLTMKLIDLAVSEKKATDKIIKGMDGIRNTVERINIVNESKKYRKEQILKYGLGRKIDSFISTVVRDYLLWVKNGKLTFYGNNIPEVKQFFQQIDELIKNGFPDVTEDFYKIPIKEENALDYIINIRSDIERRADELIKFSDLLPDEFFYTMMELLDIFARNPMYNYDTASRLFASVCIYATPSSDMNIRESIVNELEGFGKVILKFEPMYNAYLK